MQLLPRLSVPVGGHETDQYADSIPPSNIDATDATDATDSVAHGEEKPEKDQSSSFSDYCKVREGVKPYVFEVWAPYINNESGTFDF